MAGYHLLHCAESVTRRVIPVAEYGYYMDEKKIDKCRSMEDYADEHGTPAQRFFNVLCIAYGADTELFGDIVSKGFLPESRAEFCEEEYELFSLAYEKLISPRIEPELAQKVFERRWLPEATSPMLSK